MMDSINTIMNEKSNNNHKLTDVIVEKIYKIAENPSKKFRRYSIGFDANLMKYLRKLLGYRLFNRVIRSHVLK